MHGDDPDPRRHQVLELPEVKPLVTEYQLHRLACPCCQADTAARLPQDALPGGQGPRLQALVGLLTGVYRPSKAQVEQFLDDLFGVPLSTGQVCAIEGDLSQTLAPVTDELREYVRGQDANVDETGWKQGGQRRWLWVAVTKLVTAFQVTLGRGYEDFKALLGADYGGVLTSDRYGAYNGARTVRQLCWAHTIRTQSLTRLHRRRSSRPRSLRRPFRRRRGGRLRLQAPQRDHVADLQRVLPHDDTLDQQLQEPLLLGQGRLLQPAADALAERLQVRPDLPGRLPLGLQPRLLLALGAEDFPPAGDLRPPIFQLLSVDYLRLIGVEQALLLTVEPAQLGLPLLVRGPRVGRLVVRLLGGGLELV